MRRSAMTFIEMLVCLAIIALCLVALVRGIGGLSLLAARDSDDAALVPQVEALLTKLESAPPEVTSGHLEGGWRYETWLQEDAYVLYVCHEIWQEEHIFLVREGPV